jgi:hypothetical protein
MLGLRAIVPILTTPLSIFTHSPRSFHFTQTFNVHLYLQYIFSIYKFNCAYNSSFSLYCYLLSNSFFIICTCIRTHSLCVVTANLKYCTTYRYPLIFFLSFTIPRIRENILAQELQYGYWLATHFLNVPKGSEWTLLNANLLMLCNQRPESHSNIIQIFNTRWRC